MVRYVFAVACQFFGNSKAALLAIAGLIVLQPSAVAATNSDEAIRQYGQDMFNLSRDCTSSEDDLNKDIEDCKIVIDRMTARRAKESNAEPQFEDNLSQHLMLIHAQIMGLYQRRDRGRSEQSCLHAELAWFHLGQISEEAIAKDRASTTYFWNGLAAIGPCRQEFGTTTRPSKSKPIVAPQEAAPTLPRREALGCMAHATLMSYLLESSDPEQAKAYVDAGSRWLIIVYSQDDDAKKSDTAYDAAVNGLQDRYNAFGTKERDRAQFLIGLGRACGQLAETHRDIYDSALSN